MKYLLFAIVLIFGSGRGFSREIPPRQIESLLNHNLPKLCYIGEGWFFALKGNGITRLTINFGKFSLSGNDSTIQLRAHISDGGRTPVPFAQVLIGRFYESYTDSSEMSGLPYVRVREKFKADSEGNISLNSRVYPGESLCVVMPEPGDSESGQPAGHSLIYAIYKLLEQ